MRLPLLFLHVSAGILAMIAGAFAISFRKGSQAHRRSGNLFVASMLTVSAVGAYLGFMKSEADNLLGGIFAFHLVATAWTTARRGEGDGWKLEWGAPLIALTFATFNLIWGVEVARGQTAVKDQSPAVSYFFFGTLALLCAVGDVRRLVGPLLSNTATGAASLADVLRLVRRGSITKYAEEPLLSLHATLRRSRGVTWSIFHATRTRYASVPRDSNPDMPSVLLRQVGTKRAF